MLFGDAEATHSASEDRRRRVTFEVGEKNVASRIDVRTKAAFVRLNTVVGAMMKGVYLIVVWTRT